MSVKWFVQKDEAIEGPFSTEDLKRRLAAGQIGSQHMIWGQGQERWVPANAWEGEATNVPSDTAPEITLELWHFAFSGKSYGPYQRSALIAELARISSPGDVLLWTKGMKEWAPLFEFHDILSAMGVNKRTFPRADIMGKAVLKSDSLTLVAQLVSISEGGLGVQLDAGLVAGEQVNVEIQASVFREPLRMRAECRYISNGYMGLKILNMNSETRGAIMEFVQKSHSRFVLKAA